MNQSGGMKYLTSGNLSADVRPQQIASGYLASDHTGKGPGCWAAGVGLAIAVGWGASVKEDALSPQLWKPHVAETVLVQKVNVPSAARAVSGSADIGTLVNLAPVRVSGTQF